EKGNYKALERDLKNVEKDSSTDIHNDEHCPKHEIEFETDRNSVLEWYSNSAKDSQLNEQSNLDSCCYQNEIVARKVVENKDSVMQNYQHLVLENLDKACDNWNKRVNEFKKLIQDDSKAIEEPQPVKPEEVLPPDNKEYSLVSCCQSRNSSKKEKLSKESILFKWYSTCRKERTLYQVEQLKIDENEALQLLPILDFCNQIFDPGGKFCFKIIKPIFRSISFFVNISTSFGRIKRLSDPQISSEVLTAFSTSIRRETTKTIFGNLSFFVDISYENA
ncbi:hypothetical protein C2G38_2194230, partial [Gigaspora rosea]